MQPISSSRGMARLMFLVQSVRDWSSANPELAKSWDEAMEEDEQRTKAREEQAHQALLDNSAPEYLAHCGVGELQIDAIRAGLKPTTARQVVAEFVSAPKLLCLLHGGAGAGKTIAAVESLLLSRKSYIHTGALWRSAGAVARMSYFDEQSFAQLAHAPWLVVDDLGVEQSSSTFNATLDELVDNRINAKRRTVLTTNLSLDVFRQRYAQPGSRLASRLAGYALISGVGNVDLRRL